MSWRVIVWRRDRLGKWSEHSTYPGDRARDAADEAKALTVANSPQELYVALVAGQVPSA